MMSDGSGSNAKDLTSTTRPAMTSGVKTPQWELFMVMPGASPRWHIAILSVVDSLRRERCGTRHTGSPLLNVFLLRRKEDQRADLNTLARRGIGRTRRIRERRMGGEPRPAIGFGVVALEQDDFAGLQVREVIPAVLGVIGKRVRLTNSVRVHQVTGHYILGGNAPGITQCQRGLLDRPADCPPDVDLGEAMLQQLLRFRGDMIADAPGGRLERVIIVHDPGRFAHAVLALPRLWRTAHDMVEDHYFRRTGSFPQQPLDLGIVDLPHFVLVVKVGHLASLVREQNPCWSKDR